MSGKELHDSVFLITAQILPSSVQLMFTTRIGIKFPNNYYGKGGPLF